jgi:hypothetical protein
MIIYFTVLFIFDLYRVSPSNEEETIKTNFSQQLHAEREHKKSSETMSLRHLVPETYRILCLIKTLYVF